MGSTKSKEKKYQFLKLQICLHPLQRQNDLIRTLCAMHNSICHNITDSCWLWNGYFVASYEHRKLEQTKMERFQSVNNSNSESLTSNICFLSISICFSIFNNKLLFIVPCLQSNIRIRCDTKRTLKIADERNRRLWMSFTCDFEFSESDCIESNPFVKFRKSPKSDFLSRWLNSDK